MVEIIRRRFRCPHCGLEWESGLDAPPCLRCNTIGQQVEGPTTTIAVPQPVPAGEIPTEDQMREQVKTQLATTTSLTFRCQGCGWSVSWTPPAEPPVSIGQHTANCPQLKAGF